MLFKKKTNLNCSKAHGIVNNIIYTLSKIRQYKKSVFYIVIICSITTASATYMWSFFSKLIIDIITYQSSTESKNINSLLVLLTIIFVLELTLSIFNVIGSTKMNLGFSYVRQKMLQEEIKKSLNINYEMLENPEMLDKMEKAEQATISNNTGIIGMMSATFFFLTNIILLIITASVMAYFNLWIIVGIIFISFLQYLYYIYAAKKDKIETWDKLATVWRKENYLMHITQDFSYAKDIRLFNMKNWLLDKYRSILKFKYKKVCNSKNIWISNSIFVSIMSIIQNIIVYSYLIYCVIYNDLSISNFTLYIGTIGVFSSSVKQIFNNIGAFKQRSMEMNDFRSYIEINDDDNEDSCLPIPNSDEYIIEFKNVSFKYTGQKVFTLKNINITINSKEKLAIVGLNGAGKTTFVKLLVRLYDVTKGEILINGINIKKYKRKEYYKLFSPVFQNIEIFAFPLSENISMSTPENTDSQKAYDKIVKSGLKEKVDSLEKGITSEMLNVVHKDGVILSGGECQKVALARALYKDSPIIILDEPTSALDPIAEHKLYTNFNSLTENKSVIYISHRLSSIQFCNKIALFNDGMITEYGSHQELMSLKGQYYNMFMLQAQYYNNDNNSYAEETLTNE
ncbi:ABC transporter ATP-binding protein [Ruminococcus sp. Marseille-P6503]|uniref:ABC transporter ATP-binding protein n=1 Tax=Ruminococcus sp. Marseille-P6503 TaxID=2364796 RepID=UPI000F53CFB2|nr:ABC transporter ATP-binding protein [Ruminococcus sp. Marseille-P6503]